MADCTVALQVALLAKLNTLCSVPVYDAVPRGSAYPYVQLDSQMAMDAEFIDGTQIDERNIYISVWSEQRGQAQVMGILAEIKNIHLTALTLTTGQVVLLRCYRSETSRDADGVTYQGNMTLKVITQN